MGNKFELYQIGTVKKQESEILQIDDLVMDIRKHTVIRDNKKIDLTRKEFAVLEYLLLHAREVVSKIILIEHVWDIEANLFSNTIETHIGNLRNKMDRGFKKKLIHTISRVGYKVSDE
jgi:DNA-binding response OmpR family regulator